MKVGGSCVAVTGAASGLGRATADALYEAGATVLLLDRNAEALDAICRQYACRVTSSPVDVRSESEVADALNRFVSSAGALRGVVNCAGIVSGMKTVSKGAPHSLDHWNDVIGVNLTGTFNVMRLAASLMAQNEADAETGERGVIINTASIAGYEGQRGQVAYAASKAGILGMTLPVARDLAEFGIRCISIAPGLFDTELFANISEKGVKALERGLLWPSRKGLPTEFAATVRYIFETPYVNGTCIRLDGGARLPA